jgi:hypothetical protein
MQRALRERAKTPKNRNTSPTVTPFLQRWAWAAPVSHPAIASGGVAAFFIFFAVEDYMVEGAGHARAAYIHHRIIESQHLRSSALQ